MVLEKIKMKVEKEYRPIKKSVYKYVIDINKFVDKDYLLSLKTGKKNKEIKYILSDTYQSKDKISIGSYYYKEFKKYPTNYKIIEKTLINIIREHTNKSLNNGEWKNLDIRSIYPITLKEIEYLFENLNKVNNANLTFPTLTKIKPEFDEIIEEIKNIKKAEEKELKKKEKKEKKEYVNPVKSFQELLPSPKKTFKVYGWTDKDGILCTTFLANEARHNSFAYGTEMLTGKTLQDLQLQNLQRLKKQALESKETSETLFSKKLNVQSNKIKQLSLLDSPDFEREI